MTALSSGFSFDPNAFDYVPANTTIYVNFTDAGAIAHTFSILDRQGWVIPSTADLDQLFSTYGSLVSINASGPGSFPDPTR